MTEEKSARHPWTEPDNNELKEMLQAGRRSAEIAVKLGRTRYAINARVDLLNKKAARVNPDSLRLKRWTAQEDELLRALRVSGFQHPTCCFARGLNVERTSYKSATHRLVGCGADSQTQALPRCGHVMRRLNGPSPLSTCSILLVHAETYVGLL
jgi:hypothetical protein